MYLLALYYKWKIDKNLKNIGNEDSDLSENALLSLESGKLSVPRVSTLDDDECENILKDAITSSLKIFEGFSKDFIKSNM